MMEGQRRGEMRGGRGRKEEKGRKKVTGGEGTVNEWYGM